MATAPTANDLTRQQLDELDALLQRMLTLPHNSTDTSAPTPAPAATNWRIDPPGPVTATAPHLAAPPMPVEPPRPRAVEPAPPPPAPVPIPSPAPEPAVPVFEWKTATAIPPKPTELRPMPAPETPRASSAPSKTTTPAIASESSPSEPVVFVLLPLVGLNWAIDTVLGLFGPPGRFIRSGFGKNLLGFIGIGLLGYTTAHIASQQGWLTLPFPLPWPK